MQPSQFLATVCAAASMVAATCFTEGRESNYNKDNSPRIDIVCERLSGDYKKTGRRTKTACYTDTVKSRWDFEVTYIGTDATRTIDIAECVSGLTKEASCPYGGRRSYTNWSYLADPNDGTCPGALSFNITSIGLSEYDGGEW